VSIVNGGQLVARTLRSLGVRHAFGIHGGHLDSMLVAMAAEGIELIDTRHEAAAGHAADAYARATGGLGVAFATSGPGFTNIYTPLANALLDRIPLLVLTSSPPQREAELNVLQGGFDQIAAATPVTRWAHRVTTTARIPDLVSLAVRHATCGVPGPVVLELPIDVLFREIAEQAATRPTTTRVEPPGQSPSARTALEGLLARATIPVASTSWGHGVIDARHPCYLGGPAALGALPFLAGEPDLLLVLGARRGIFMGGRGSSMVPAEARVVHVDVDGTEIGRIGSVDLGVRSDVGEFVGALARTRHDWPDWSAWNESTKGAAGAHALLYADAPAVTPSGRIHPYVAAREVLAAVGDDALVVYDGGEASGWANFFARAHDRGDWFGIGYLGGLGVGPGFAIGAQVARPHQRVVAVTGDGAMGFHIQELDTMVRKNLPIVTVVFNNLGWGMSLHGQQLVFGEGTRVVVDLPETRYDRIAEGFGLHGERASTPDEIGPALKRALDAGRPACVDIAVAPDVTHPVMADLEQPVEPGHLRIPYYESIPPGEV
jgi:acetolactate synthase-1/2/3 large subunit